MLVVVGLLGGLLLLDPVEVGDVEVVLLLVILLLVLAVMVLLPVGVLLVPLVVGI